LEGDKKAKMSPHIKGEEGYPPQYMPSAEEAQREK
jgi:hypothetical protein